MRVVGAKLDHQNESQVDTTNWSMNQTQFMHSISDFTIMVFFKQLKKQSSIGPLILYYGVFICHL